MKLLNTALILLLLLTNCQQTPPADSSNTSAPIQETSNPVEEESASMDSAALAKAKQITVYFNSKQDQYLLFGQEQTKDSWNTTYDTIQCVVGYNGIAQAGKKREGDGKTPSGTFSLGAVFGYENGLDLDNNFIELEPSHHWMSDTSSSEYNTLIDYDPAPLYAEKMERNDVLYKYGIVINYNTDPIVTGLGSAIFLHIYRSSQKPTAGCVAVSENDLVRLIHWLQDADQADIRIIQ